MNNLVIEKTYSTPYVYFNAENGKLVLSGESFPENASRFYTPVIQWIGDYIKEPSAKKIEVDFEITYFNSSTSKVFLNIFRTLEQAVEYGRDIRVNWRCNAENESSIECGEEFKEDLESLPFQIVIVDIDQR